MTEIHGECHPAFGAVREVFAGNFAQGLELGASVAVTHHGEAVVDLWAGDADTGGRPWERDTIVNVWSTTKTMAAICMLMLADRGEIDIDAPVATYWPEFAAKGKEGVKVAHRPRAHRRALGLGSGDRTGGPLRLGQGLWRPRRAGAVVGAGRLLRLPRPHPGLPRG